MPRASWSVRSAPWCSAAWATWSAANTPSWSPSCSWAASTFAVGLLPTFAAVGWLAPVLMVSLRLVQGLALGGEYGGAATYVAEHAPRGRRGYATSWIQTTATLGFFLSLAVIALCRTQMDAKVFAEWGWRIPFLVSLILLVFSVYIRLKLNESPIFTQMKAEGKGSKSPLTDSFLRYPNNRLVLLALLGATAGQGVVWYTGQFYALFFLTITLKLDFVSAYTLIGDLAADRHAVLHLLRLAVRQDRPAQDHPGGLPDRGGHLLPAVRALTHYVNPDLEAFQAKTKITVTADPAQCNFHIFVGPWSKFTDCDRAKDALTKSGLSFTSVKGEVGKRS